MDIPKLSMAMSANKLQQDFGVAMLSMSLDNAEAVGEALAEVMDSSMELSVNPDVGANFDVRV
ncbi:MAG: YjfB family protein [Lachnospiraceae bacterium]|nr:YjfB family protein [Lachnospiraceae bacterium]